MYPQRANLWSISSRFKYKKETDNFLYKLFFQEFNN